MRDLKKHLKTKEAKKEIDNFFLTNLFVKRIRNFFNQTLFPSLQKISLSILLVVVVLVVALKFFKPQYLDKLTNKTGNYFLHVLRLDNYNFNSIKISGTKRVQEEDVLAIINKIKRDYAKVDEEKKQSFLIQVLPQEIKNNLGWVNKVKIKRQLPNSVKIEIEEYDPFAIWLNEGEKFVIDKDGNVIEKVHNNEFAHLIILSGRYANLHAKSLFNILVTNPDFSANVYSATLVGGRRWDVRFENGLVAKLPYQDLIEAWQELIKIYNTPGALKGLNSIDLRIKGKIYLEYGDNVIKEIKNFKL